MPIAVGVWLGVVDAQGLAGAQRLPAPVTEISCPQEVLVEQRAVVVSAPWASSLEKLPHRLVRVTFFDGPPEEQASLVPDSDVKSKDGSVATWRLPQNGPRGYFLSCGYAHTTVRMVQRLAPSFSECVVSYGREAAGPGLRAVKRITCR